MNFEQVHYAGSIEIKNNNKLTKVPSFPAVERTGVPEDAETFDPNRLSGTIEFQDNPSLKSISGFGALETAGTLRIWHNDSLEEISGFENLEALNALVIRYNPELGGLPEFPALRRINRTLNIQGGGNIRQCEVDALLEQIESEPSDHLVLEDLSDEPCD